MLTNLKDVTNGEYIFYTQLKPSTYHTFLTSCYLKLENGDKKFELSRLKHLSLNVILGEHGESAKFLEQLEAAEELHTVITALHDENHFSFQDYKFTVTSKITLNNYLVPSQ